MNGDWLLVAFMGGGALVALTATITTVAREPNGPTRVNYRIVDNRPKAAERPSPVQASLNPPEPSTGRVERSEGREQAEEGKP